MLPPALRDDAAMLYAWCRYCDDVIDGQIMGHDQIADYKDGQKERLERLRSDTRRALDGENLDNPVYTGLARVIARHEIDHKYPFELLKGFEMDAEDRVYETLEDLLDYCYHVAGVVGVMMAQIMGVRSAAVLDRASDLGLAFQLTNIARDVIDDAKARRVFVPRDILMRCGAPVEAAKLERSENWAAAYQGADALLLAAERYYASSKVGIKRLPFRCAWAIFAALYVYRDIGRTLQNKGPDAWAGRVSAGKARKASLALGAIVPALGRKRTTETPRDGLYSRPA